jgi:hypothetical protein
MRPGRSIAGSITSGVRELETIGGDGRITGQTYTRQPGDGQTDTTEMAPPQSGGFGNVFEDGSQPTLKEGTS